MAYGDTILGTIPTVGSTSGPLYAENISEFLQSIKERLETKVAQDGLLISGDLELNAQRLTEIGSLSFENLGAPLGATRAVYFSGGDLYVDDGSGTSIQVTSAGALNVASVSGINGTGYGASGVEILWVAGSTLFKLKDAAAANSYADIQVQRAKITDVTSGNAVTLTAPVLAGNITVSLPNSLPASSSVLLLDNAGLMSSTRDLSIDSITLSGDITAVNYNHGDHDIYISAMGGIGVTSGAALIAPNLTTMSFVLPSSGDSVAIPIDLKFGKTVESVVVYWNPNGAAGTKTFAVRETAMVLGSATLVGGGSFFSSTSTSSSPLASNATSSSFPVSATGAYALIFSGGSAGGEEVFGIRVRYSEA
jgi:hypothetical protein